MLGEIWSFIKPFLANVAKSRIGTTLRLPAELENFVRAFKWDRLS